MSGAGREVSFVQLLYIGLGGGFVENPLAYINAPRYFGFMKTTRFLGISLSFLASVSTFAGGYDVDAKWKVPAPPRPGSAIDRKDFADLRRWQTVRTEKECRIASSQNFMSALVLFGPKTGLLTERQFTKVEHLLEEIVETSEKVAKPFKDHYQRPRPYDVDKRLEPCIRKPGGTKSYPSSHAMAGMAAGLILGDLFPSQADLFRKAGIQIGTNRILGGVHHPSDVGVGQRLGEQLVEVLKSNREFRRDFADAKARL